MGSFGMSEKPYGDGRSQIVEVFLVRRYYCPSCHGAGSYGYTDGSSSQCNECKGSGFRESKDMLTDAEVERVNTAIDWQADALRPRT